MHKFNTICCILLLTGCSTTPQTFITDIQPKIYEIPIKSTILFEQSNDATWNDLLTMFSQSEFRIERINMNAHQVTLRYTGRPGLYVDCGKKKINTEGNELIFINAKRLYNYRAYHYIHLETYYIKNNFTGYINLLSTGDDISSQVVAQFDYELETDIKKTTTRGSKFSTNQHETLNFNSFKSMRSELFKTNCRSTGKLEAQVFKMISKMHAEKPLLR